MVTAVIQKQRAAAPKFASAPPLPPRCTMPSTRHPHVLRTHRLQHPPQSQATRAPPPLRSRGDPDRRHASPRRGPGEDRRAGILTSIDEVRP